MSFSRTLAVFFGACLSFASLADTMAVEAGRRIYRDGLLPSGDPVTAIVANDVEILGTQFSCQSCHGRSGMGASEGAYIVPPIAAQFLFADSPQPKRPAYDAQSLARVLREGVTAGGRELGDLMPRYRLDDDQVAALAVYLATLSAGNSPGVDDQQIRFAAAFAEGVEPRRRAAVMSVLRAFAEDINRETRNDSERWDRGYTPASRLPTVFRKWVVDEWMLTGAPETWDAQLTAYYRKATPFAMLGGLGDGSWGPVARFCEREALPCLLPSTDMPETEAGDFYTLYFSRGIDLEAGLIATHLKQEPTPRVSQVFCRTPAASRGAAVLQASLAATGIPTESLPVDCGSPADLASTLASLPPGESVAAVLWLEQAQLAAVAKYSPAGRKYFSSTLLQRERPHSLAALSGPVFLAHPFRLPGKTDSAYRRFQVWAQSRQLEVTAPREQASAFFTMLTVKHAIKHMGRFFVRDFMLDTLDHAQGLAVYVPIYPRVTIGPGQRFLTKGGYILPLVDGKPAVRDAVWILP